MDFKRKPRQRFVRKPEYENLEVKYPQNVILYRKPPQDDIKLQEFEDLALERLRVLRIFEQANSKNLRILSDDWKTFINAELTQEGLKGYLRLCTTSAGEHTSEQKRESELEARRRDYLSHFILRLAYCRTAELRRWFLKMELDLFKYRFSALSPAEIKIFLQHHKLSFTPLTEDEKDVVKDGLYESTMGQSVARIELLDFYRVPFIRVPDLVRQRRCFLRGGYAYVNTLDFISVVTVFQHNEIEHGLNTAQRLIADVEADDRISHLLKSLHTSYVGKDYAVNKTDAVSIEQLDQLSKKSFPLCMRFCHEHLRANHHHKHGGRMQYGLFLKSIGVTLEDSIRFWRDEFTKKIDTEKFARSYEYNIHHNYGKKGSMVNYSAYSCLKVIGSVPGPGDCHGCPYRSFDQATLKNRFIADGLSSAHVQEVMAYVAKGHYQLACGKYFQITHDAEQEVGIIHPSQYFQESQALIKNRTEKKTKVPERRLAKRPATTPTEINGGNEDDEELWHLAESQEITYRSQEAEKTAWEDDLDISTIQC